MISDLFDTNLVVSGDGDADAARGASGGGGEVARPDRDALVRFEHPTLPVK